MVIALLAGALAAPTVCDPAVARTLLEQARIDERRAPVTHPEMIPGLALAGTDDQTPLHQALQSLCETSESVSIAPVESWEDATFASYNYRVTGTQTEGCALVRNTLGVTVGLSAGGEPTYRLSGEQTHGITPIGACDRTAEWREETVIEGDGTPVRLVLAVDRSRDGVRGSQVVVRTATVDGWTEDLLLSPAPERYLGGMSGPLLDVVEVSQGEVWVVQHADRSVDSQGCTPVAGQTVWRRDDDGWRATEGREALALLARRGLWRFAGSDGWLHIVLQDAEGNTDGMAYRATRLGKRYPEPLRAYASSDLPDLNPGFTVMAPAPFRSENEATIARKRWRSMHRHYVKRAWQREDPCTAYNTGG